MPYDIRKFKEGYKVCKKGTQECYSKDPIPLKRAVAQRKAIGISKAGGAKLEGCGRGDYVVAIPTYDRVDIIQEKTLPLLLSRGVLPESIYLFVANKEEEEKYKAGIPAEKYYKIVVGKKGISYQRNFIIDYFPENQYIIFIDDDINNIVIKKKGKVGDLTDLDKFFKESYDKLKKYNKYLWATKNMYNPFYKNLAKEEAEIGLTQFSGDLIGVINRKKMKIKYTLERGEGEQMELALMYHKEDGGVIRFNNVIVITTKLTDGGKIKERGSKEDRVKDLSHNVKLLEKAYPEYVDKITIPQYSSREKVVYKNIPVEKVEGAGKKLDIDFSDREGENVYYSKIDDTTEYKNIKQRLFEELEKTKIPKIEGKRKDEKRTRGDLLGYNAYTMTFGCGNRRNLGTGEFSTNAKHPELFDLCIKYGNHICPKGFQYQAITINKNMKAKKHKDGSNNGMSVINGLGDFTGGGLFVYPNSKTKKPELYDLKNHILVFNGAKLAHRTDAYKGTRYTLIFYSQKGKCENKGKVMEGGDFFDDEDWTKLTGGDFDWWGLAKDLGSQIVGDDLKPIVGDIVDTGKNFYVDNFGTEEQKEEKRKVEEACKICKDGKTGGAIPINKKLYEKAKAEVYPKYKKPSAYRSGAVVKRYKELGGKFKEDGERKLKRWFQEEWKDIGGKDYPVYRPTKRITKDTPLTPSEITPQNLSKQVETKQKIKGEKNLPPFEKRGGALYAKDKYATGEKELTPTEKKLVKREMGDGNPIVAEIQAEPMGDDDIRKYFPNAKIIKYSELKDVSRIEDLLPRPKTFFFLLYERSLNVGHWVLVSRYKDNGIDTIEFFCSYGSRIDEPLTWTPVGMRVQLGQDKPYLSNLLDKSPFRVIYNPVQFQSKKSPISTCGAYDTLRASELQKHNTTLDEFNDMLEEVKKATGLTYDEIVSNLVHLR